MRQISARDFPPNMETLAAIEEAKKGLFAGTVNTSSVDAMIKSIEEPVSTKGLEAFYALREEARRNGLQGMSLNDINAEIHR